ncbi:hypothetical protein HG537_0A07270 [Torulaspora globosa]|uniref:Uncharacterized protein n=1 Tax=Torulaspora globosa TaxID=48254 RepID=A0A7H9HMC3_9SACH|nr:hypothetical protein HG537_0A07270 [Torulaspora sp. CBS 2947]
MGLFSGSNDKNIDKVNERILEDELGGPVADKMGSISDSVSSIWKDSSSLWSHALEDPDKFLRDISGLQNHKERDVWENFAMSASDAVGSLLDVFGLPGGYGNPRRIKYLMDDPFTSEEIVAQGVTGLFNYRTPTELQFTECNQVGGLSVWNTKGWWRCLFPEKEVSKRLADQKDQLPYVLTKEKVENDHTHKFGLFFPEYTGYLTWKTHMNQLIREKKNKQTTTAKKQLIPATPEDFMVETEPSSNDKKKVIGTAEYVTYTYTPEGQNEVKKTKTYYDNGTVLVKSQRKLTPADDGKPQIETSEKIVPVEDDEK